MVNSWSAASIERSTTAFPAAIGWVEQLLVGRLGTALAVLAIAWIGIALLQGRLAIRDGIRVVLGCFVLFGAPIIAHGILTTLRGPERQSPILIAPQTKPAVPIHITPPDFDPYAGASVPTGQ